MNNPKFDVTAIGNAIVDVLAKADDALLAEHKLPKGGMSLIDAPTAETSSVMVPSSPAMLSSKSDGRMVPPPMQLRSMTGVMAPGTRRSMRTASLIVIVISGSICCASMPRMRPSASRTARWSPVGGMAGPPPGRVTRPTSIRFSSIARSMSGVLPVETTMSSAGNLWRRSRSTFGSR